MFDPVMWLTKNRLGRAKELGLGANSVQVPHADNGAFPTLQDPESTVDYMQERFEQDKQRSGDGLTMRGQLPQWNPGEFDEWKAAKTMGKPTVYGNIMQDRFRRSTGGYLPGVGQTAREDRSMVEKYPSMQKNFPLDYLKRLFG